MAWGPLSENVKAIDLSEHNVSAKNAAAGKLIDFFELKRRNPNVQVVISRLAGASSLDPHFDHNYDECGEAGFDQGLYLNANPYYSVDYMLNEWWGPGIGSRKPPLIVMDAEVNGWKDEKGKWHDRKSPEEATAHVKEVLATIRREWPLSAVRIYSKNWWNDNIIKGWERNEKFWTSHYPYWERHEGEEKEWREAWTFEEVDKFLPITETHIPKRAYYVTDEQLFAFQFTSKGKIDPIWDEEDETYVDLNYIKLDEYKLIWKKDPPAIVEDDETPIVINPGNDQAEDNMDIESMTKQQKVNQIRGKWVYIWLLRQIFNGDLNKIIAELKRAKVSGVAIKVHNGWDLWDEDYVQIDPFINLCRRNNIKVVLWGYNYIKYNPIREADIAIQACEKYKDVALAYLIDAEAEAKDQRVNSKKFMDRLVPAMNFLNIPISLNSFRYPSLHREIAWDIMRSGTDFDSPQVYYRNGDPEYNIDKSRLEFGAMSPKLPFIPAGDMYYEHGIKPTVNALQRYLEICRDDPDIPATFMWAMDSNETTPELWEAFANFEWTTGETPVEETPPGEDYCIDEKNAVDVFVEAMKNEVQYDAVFWRSVSNALLTTSDSFPEPAALSNVEHAVYLAIKEAIERIDELAMLPIEDPLYVAAVKASLGLNVRTGPGTSFSLARSPLRNGERISVYQQVSIKDAVWGRINPMDKQPEWVHLGYTERI